MPCTYSALRQSSPINAGTSASAIPVPGTPSSAAPPERLLALDVLRGLTVAGMILVTDPGTYSAVYPPLRHAAWDGATLTDMIFPCFLVMVGVSMTLSFAARIARGASRASLALHACRRAALLIFLGLLVNGFPFYDLSHLRFPGILQRIGVCYLLAALLYLALCGPAVRDRTRRWVLLGVLFGALALYWALLRLYPTPGFGAGRLDSLGSLPAVVDRAVFGVRHLWAYGTTPGYGVTYDSEGLLSTLPALATVLFGVLAGEEIRSGATRSHKCAILALDGTVLWLGGLGWSRSLVLNKRIYTPSFAIFSAGLSLLLLAGLLYVVDVKGWRRGWTLPRIFGTNAIFAFVLSGIITSALTVIHVTTAAGRVGLHAFLYGWGFATWLPPRLGSLAYAVAIVLLNAALIYPFYRRRIFLKL